ncbi:restriction endonuclease subunit S [Brachyspira aalborgi]|uniref:Restriction endonuclease subunit S n=1 Tax=Brachyspira aalborgi TaxID=29522 RepID=A0A5C8FDK0_9SPIR|nr:restriction endonuclease subunit S [Brachyspira aalborgi]TXJ46690.1 restriction endonuclease subunit S [Brachyspira aalborgi]
MNKSHTNWKKLKIEDCADVIGGGTPSTNKKEYWDGDISWITPKDLSNYNNRYISKGSRNISEKGLKYSSARLLPKNSVLLTTRAPIGYLAISKKELATNQGFKSLIMKNGNVPEFFYYLLKNNINKLLQYASGTTFMELNATNLKSIEFYIPEVYEQKRIASILSALDDKIELNNKTNKILEDMAQTIFKEWFINFNFPNEDGKPYKKSGGEMIDSELGKIPKGWKVITLKDIISIAKGKKPKATSDKITEKFTMPYLTINCYNNEATEYTEYNEKMHVKELDIIMVMDGNAGKIFYGKEGILSSTMAKLIVEDSNLNELVFYFLKSMEYDLMYHTVGSVIQHADKQYMLNKKFCVSLDNLERLSDIFKCIRKEISLNKKENEKLSNIRDSLLPKLMTPKGRRADGEIRV